MAGYDEGIKVSGGDGLSLRASGRTRDRLGNVELARAVRRLISPGPCHDVGLFAWGPVEAQDDPVDKSHDSI